MSISLGFFRLRLVSDWQWILTHSWSIFAAVAVFVVSLAEVLLPVVGVNLPLWLFAILTAMLAVLGIALRVVFQNTISGRRPASG